MSRTGLLLRLCLGTLIVAAAAAAVRADEGFWPFDAIPRADIERKYNFRVTDEWLRHLQLASVNFDGASGSFVSPDGLVLTNHHVGLDAVAKLSTADRDLVRNGFLARDRSQELKAPDLELRVLATIEDVTERVNRAVTANMSDGAAFSARRANIAAIEKESLAATGLTSNVVTLYQGARYHLYRFRKFTDVRLVFAPEADIAFFGGDPDNFTFPRYCLDMMLFRVYENGAPLKSEHFLKWSTAGAKDGDLVFTSGHPGATQRLNTVAHLEYLRDTGIPLTLRLLERRHAALVEYGTRGAEQQRQAQEERFGIENSLKSFRGQLAGLRADELLGQKRRAEAALRKAVESDADLNARFGGGWSAVAKARGDLPQYLRPYQFLESSFGAGSRYVALGRTLLRLADEGAKPDSDRLPEFTEARRASLELGLFSAAPIYPALEAVKLASFLSLLREELGASAPAVVTLLAGKTPDSRAAELVTQTRLGDVAVRKQLASGGRSAVDASSDPMIAFAKSIDAEARALRKRYEDEVTGVERNAYARIAQAIFAVQGASAYPDATSTLRLSYGAVKGYQDDGRTVAPFTQFAGLYERAQQHKHQPPYAPPKRWMDRKSALNLEVPFNFVTTNDIVGGNSGSPLVNRAGEIVGIAFDGNIHSLPGYFIYDERANRTVAVDTRAMVEALRSVYDAAPLAAELTGQTAGSR